MFYSDTFPQIIQSLWLARGKMLSGFAIGHPGQCRVVHIYSTKLNYIRCYMFRCLCTICRELWNCVC